MDWKELLTETDKRELQNRVDYVDKGDVPIHNYTGEWGNLGEFVSVDGKAWSWGEMWDFLTKFKYMRNLSNIPDENGRCLVGYGSKKLHRCLELGCDWGHRWNVLEYCFEEVYGVEAMRSTVEMGQGYGRNIKHGLIENIPYDDEYFDVVISAHVLEHGISPEITLSEIYRVTKPHGWSVHTIPCRLDKVVEAESGIHKSNINHQQWMQMFSDNGFSVELNFFGWNFNQEDWTVIARCEEE